MNAAPVSNLLLDELFLFPLPSGDRGISLRTNVPWGEFSNFAGMFADATQGKISCEQNSYDELSIATVIDGEPFALVYDKWSGDVSLEPQSPSAAANIVTILERLKQLRIAG